MRYQIPEEPFLPTCVCATRIYIEDGETEEQVLCAIIRASFELAQPAGMSFMADDFDPKQNGMTDNEARSLIGIKPVGESEDALVRIDKRKEYPILACRAKRKSEPLPGKLLGVQTWITPIGAKECFLFAVECLRSFRKFFELLPELIRVEYGHRRVETRPAFRSRNALLKEARNARGRAYSAKDSVGNSDVSASRTRWTSAGNPSPYPSARRSSRSLSSLSRMIERRVFIQRG